MAKFTKLNIGDSVASSGGRVWKKLSAKTAWNGTDLTGTTWRFGEYIQNDYKTSFSYDITATRKIVQETEELSLSDLNAINCIVSKGNYNILGNKTDGNGIYYGYNSTPRVLSRYRDNFLYTEIHISGGADVLNADLIAWLEANGELQ